MYVHRHTDENDVETSSRQIKETTTRKDDKKTTVRDFSPALQPKSANSLRSLGQKQSGLKESRIPLKRADSNCELDNSKKVKRQQLKGIEKTHRKGETEREWVPDTPLDFSAFDNKFYEQENIFQHEEKEEETFPSFPRRFTTLENKKAVSLPPFTQQEVAVVDFPTPSAVEYGPEKEIELPFTPEDPHMIQFGDFTAFADISAYEAINDEDKEFVPEFDDDDDYYYLHNLFTLDRYENLLYFECPYELVEEDLNEPIDVPFSNSLFDLQLIECSN